MTDQRRAIIFRDFECNAAVDPIALDKMQTDSGLELPEEYVSFLRFANGGEGPIGLNAYVALWKVEELIELNNAYEVSQYFPELLVIGSDGGGEAFAFDQRSEPWSVVSVPFIGMDWSLAQRVGSTFDEFLEAMYRL